MKKALIFLVIAMGAQGFEFIPDNKAQDVAQKIARAHFEDFRLFQKEVDQMAAIAAMQQDQLDLSLLQKQLAAARYAFKRIEFIFDYRQTSYNYFFINGGPFPKIDGEGNTGLDVAPPKGLQTLSELLAGEEAAEQENHLKQLTLDLKESVDFIAESYLHIKLDDTQIIETLRSGIVRVFCLGLSGFDALDSDGAMQEAIISMESMEKAFLYFEEDLRPGAQKTFQEIKKRYSKAIQLLNANPDFDTFDRMNFLNEVVNPLYGNLLDFQELNGIPINFAKYDAQNYQARNLFDEDFLNIDHYSAFSYASLKNPEAIALGKTLFYDPILSKDLKTSCASCHDPAQAFTDGLAKSQSNIPGKFTRRNSPTLIDVGYSSRYFWDMREYNLERQVAHVVNDTLEFNMNFYQIAERLKQSSEYVQMFEKAYGGISKKPIGERSISNAIAAYVNTLKSFNSAFDQYVRGEISSYPTAAARGFNLFMGKAACGSCHFAPVFNGLVPPFYIETESEVLGITLGLDTIYPQKDLDPGRINNGLRREALPHFKNSFKTVTVRNTALTAPYMHNGLFQTLEEVIEFYNQGGGGGLGLEIENQTLSDAPLNLIDKEKFEIIAFLQTLTDTSGLTKIDVRLPLFEDRPDWNKRAARGG